MKMLDTKSFLIEAGIQMPRRDMSAYNGKLFECACGNTHAFDDSMEYRNFVASGANAKMIVDCPMNYSVSTLIQTKYKFIVIFDGFVSLAGCKGD